MTYVHIIVIEFPCTLGLGLLRSNFACCLKELQDPLDCAFIHPSISFDVVYGGTAFVVHTDQDPAKVFG
jgi:hypothetical protein